ncbi:MAG: hypothetical protein VYC34_01340, partial [Planctomycetota bacterium]|nr:hypothetical protein [Planctomycetota bacterium]
EAGVALLFAPLGSGGIEEAVIEAFRQTAARRKEGWTLLVMGTSSLRSLQRTGDDEAGMRVVALHQTKALKEMLCAADVALSGGVSKRAAADHFVADALRCGAPVIAGRWEPGAELLTPGKRETDMPGALVEGVETAHWRRVFDEEMHLERVRALRRVAAARAESLGMERFMDRLERSLTGLAEGGR